VNHHAVRDPACPLADPKPVTEAGQKSGANDSRAPNKPTLYSSLCLDFAKAAIPLLMVTTTNPSSVLLNLHEVAAELRCSLDSVRRRIRSRELPCYKLGEGAYARTRVARADLDAYLAKHYMTAK
jgi:excisionase family DNA binding protein